MKFIPLLFTFFLSAHALGQADSAAIIESPVYNSLATLSRTEIERLPAESFLELVQGAFPFVGNASVIEEEYTFLVDGFVTVNPNAINLSQIESIRFFPAGTLLSRGSLGKRGTFVISTIPQQHAFSFSTKTGAVLRKADPNIPGQVIDNGLFSLNELNFRRKSEKAFVSAAVSYLHRTIPAYRYNTGTVQAEGRSAFQRTRATASGGYQLSRQLTLEGGMFYTAQPRQGDYLLDYRMASSSQTRKVNGQTNYAGAQVALQYRAAAISNRLMAEINATDDETTDVAIDRMPGGELFHRTSNTDASPLVYAFTNQFAWHAIRKQGLTLQAAVTARFRQIEVDEKSLTESRSPQGMVSSSGWMMGSRSRSFSLSPTLILHYKNILTAEAGATYDSYSFSGKGPNDNKEILPHGALKLELASLLNTPSLTSLELTTNFSRYYTAYDRADRLETEYMTNIAQGPMNFVPNFDLRNYYPSSNWLTTLGISVWQNRLAIRGGFRRYDKMIMAYFLGYQGSALMLVQEPLVTQSWSVEVKTALLQTPAKRWDVYAMAFHDKFERKDWGQNGIPSYAIPVDPYALDAGKSPWRGGLRTSVAVNRFFLQAAALFALNETNQVNGFTANEDLNNYRMNFLLLGYQWPLRKGIFKSVEASLQSRNLPGSRAHLYDRYLGAGVQVRL